LMTEPTMHDLSTPATRGRRTFCALGLARIASQVRHVTRLLMRGAS
jgi:hypothetical protein